MSRRATRTRARWTAEFAEVAGRQEHVHPERQGSVRPRIAKNFQGAAEGARDEGPGFSAYDPKQAELPGDLHEDQGDESGWHLHRRARRRELRPVDQRQGRGPWTEQRRGKLFLPDGFTTDALFQRSEGGPRTPRTPSSASPASGSTSTPARRRRSSAASRRPSRRQGGRSVCHPRRARPRGCCSTRSRTPTERGKASSTRSSRPRSNNGLIGSFEINENGDITGAKGAALLFTIYKGTDKLVTFKTAAPKANLVDAARKAAAG